LLRAFKLKNLIFQNISPNYKLDSKTKPFDDEVLFILCGLHSYVQIQHGGFISAFLFSIWTLVTWSSRHPRSNISMEDTREFKLHVSGNDKRQVRNFLGKVFVERFHFIFSFLRRKNDYVFQLILKQQVHLPFDV
jgi:hypothetical protein